MKKRFRIVLLITLILLIPIRSNAATNDYDDEASPHYDNKGNITWTTTDKKAAPKVTSWSTIGFTLRADTCKTSQSGKPQGNDGNPRKNNKYATLMLQDDWIESKPSTGVTTKTKFTIPQEAVTKAVKKAGISSMTLQLSDGQIYLNGIFQINYRNGKSEKVIRTRKGIYKLGDIMFPSDVSWSRPQDFRDRFDVPVPYKPKPQPVYLTTMKYDGKKYTTIERKKLAEVPTNQKFETKTDMILAKLELEDGTNYHLYRTHWAKMEEKESKHNNGTYRKVRDKVKTQYNPKTNFENYKVDLRRLRNRDYEVEDGGIEIVCVYKKYKPSKPNTNHQEEIEEDIIEPSTDGVIQADERGAELFDSEKGVPSTEYQYVNVTSSEYLTQYKFRRYYGTKTYQQVIPPDKDTDEEGNLIPPTIIPVTRSFSYWKIVDLNVYNLSFAEVKNGSLPNEKVKLYPTKFYIPPKVSYEKHSKNLIEPADGQKEIGQIKVRNDSLVFNGQTIMSDSWCSSSTTAPKKLPVEKTVSDYAFYVNRQQIEGQKANGTYESEGTITYKRMCHVGAEAEGETIEYDIDNINDVIVHTPTICNGQISDVRQYNQMLRPDRSVAGLVLDRKFTIKSDTKGYHSELKGYEERDYQKYIGKKEVSFSFDTYLNSNYYKASTWIPLEAEETEFYLPIWVKEGYHSVYFRNRTINCDFNQGLEKTEENANTEAENYVATSESTVQISGRIYGMSLYDVTDYPIWEKVFRKPNSLEMTGFTFQVGKNNQNGTPRALNEHTKRATFPMINGVHPYYQNIGAIKTGYFSRFYLTTVGNMYSKADSIKIIPSFYFIDSKGKRETVDVYYTETIGEKQQHLVKVGGALDKMNKKKMKLGEIHRGVPLEELKTKAKIEKMSLNEAKASKAEVYTFAEMEIPKELRTYTGTNYAPSEHVPSGVSADLVTKSRQKWYFEYYLPSEIHVAPKGFDVYEYGRQHYGLDYQESFWKKDGYLLVNFAIETIQDGERHLNYINETNAPLGYCNMWKMEGFTYQKKDHRGKQYQFQDGDTIFYYLNRSAAKDYISAGTH